MCHRWSLRHIFRIHLNYGVRRAIPSPWTACIRLDIRCWLHQQHQSVHSLLWALVTVCDCGVCLHAYHYYYFECGIKATKCSATKTEFHFCKWHLIIIQHVFVFGCLYANIICWLYTYNAWIPHSRACVCVSVCVVWLPIKLSISTFAGICTRIHANHWKLGIWTTKKPFCTHTQTNTHSHIRTGT